MRLSWTRLPFRYRTGRDFERKLTEYIGQVFYEQLPAAGYQVREEQIFTAFRIARALVAGETLLAEAGAGTGKTLAYLIPAVCFARLQGRPVVVACAGDALAGQLLGRGGDVDVLSRHLHLQVDARPARDPGNYLCEVKVEMLRSGGVRRRGLARLLRWARLSVTGERREIPDVPDDTWELAAWDTSLHCDTCRRRGACRLTRAREHYRQSTDLVVCSHDLFLRDLWTRRTRQEAGARPLLPDYSAVIADEGHLIPNAVQRTAGQAMNPQSLERTLAQVARAGRRAGLVRAQAAACRAAQAFWAAVQAATIPGQAERLAIGRDARLLGAAAALQAAVAHLQDELTVEEAMSAGTAEEVRLLALQERLDRLATGLALLHAPPGQSVCWAANGQNGPELSVVPRGIGDLLQELWGRRLPVVLTSATLAGAGSFDWLKRMLGAPGARHSQAGTPFRLARQVLVYLPADQDFDPAARLVQLLQASRGRALVLLPSPRALSQLRTALPGHRLPWRLLWEGDAERSALVQRFERDVASVLVGTSFWAGIDVPGQALSLVVVPQLPFPPDDPLVTARREDAARAELDPFAAVDVREMAITLKQGWGRLIRTAADRGVLALLDTAFRGSSYERAVRATFPARAKVTGNLGAVNRFLA